MSNPMEIFSDMPKLDPAGAVSLNEFACVFFGEKPEDDVSYMFEDFNVYDNTLYTPDWDYWVQLETFTDDHQGVMKIDRIKYESISEDGKTVKARGVTVVKMHLHKNTENVVTCSNIQFYDDLFRTFGSFEAVFAMFNRMYDAGSIRSSHYIKSLTVG